MAEQEPTPPPRDAIAELPVPALPRPPFWMIAVALIGVVVSWLPLALIARGREARSSEPRVQIMQDMGTQPKFREQQTNALFADDRAMRPAVPGTVARGRLESDDRYYRGFVRVYDGTSGKWVVQFDSGLPEQVKITPELLRRGQQRFNIYCYVCHGLDGSGRGPINERVNLMREDNVTDLSWTAPAVLMDDRIRQQPDGQIFNTITNGIRSMPSYSSQIPTEDRWAIVAYVRALQFSQCAPAAVVPPGQKMEGP
jgi:mono/diheme cytochrome c family protein